MLYASDLVSHMKKIWVRFEKSTVNVAQYFLLELLGLFYRLLIVTEDCLQCDAG